MNKRNTVIATIVLVVLVMLLFTRSCVRRHACFNRTVVEIEEQAVCKKDSKPYASIDSTTVRNSDYPIVIHYKEPKQFDDAYTMNHIIGLTWNVLDSCPPMPDSTNAIHVYIRNHSNKTKNVYLGIYYKTSMNEDLEYKVTYPVTDHQGFHIASDSGSITSVMHWKSYGANTPVNFRKQADERMRKLVEKNLLKDVFKKMGRNEDSE